MKSEYKYSIIMYKESISKKILIEQTFYAFDDEKGLNEFIAKIKAEMFKERLNGLLDE